MGRHWSKGQSKTTNDFEDAMDRGLIWIRNNRQKTAFIAGGVLAAVILAIIVVYSLRSRTTEAWNELALAQGLAYSGRPDQAMQEVEQLAAGYPKSEAAAYGLIFGGDVLYQRGQYQDAQKLYQKVLSEGGPAALDPIALSDIGLSEEAAGDCKDAIAMEQRFLDAYPDHFLAPEVHYSMARCLEALGQSLDAKAAYQKIALEYPGTSFAAEAQQKIK